jgi:hypothetical protein
VGEVTDDKRLINDTYQRETVIEIARLVAVLAMQLPINGELEDILGGIKDELVDLLEEA